jgi:DNA-binding IclR family transcriptional regulator
MRAVQTRKGALPLHTIARRTGLPKSLVFRLLSTLRHIGWVEKRDRRYRLLVRVPRRKRRPPRAPEPVRTIG